MHANPLLTEIVDNEWRKDIIKDLNIWIPENAKMVGTLDNEDKKWNDTGLHDLLRKYTNLPPKNK